MKYLLTDDEDTPLAICEGVSNVQHTVEQYIMLVSPNKDDKDLTCLEDFRVYEVGQRSSIAISLRAMPDTI